MSSQEPFRVVHGFQARFREFGAACPTCGLTRHLHGERDNGPDYPPDRRYELIWQCWKCAYRGISMRTDQALHHAEEAARTEPQKVRLVRRTIQDMARLLAPEGSEEREAK